MAISRLDFDRTTGPGALLADGLQLEFKRENLIRAKDQMLTMINNQDGTLIANFDEVVKKYKVGGWVFDNAVTDPQRTVAKGIWDELNSALSKLTTDASVSSVQAALLQLFNKLR